MGPIFVSEQMKNQFNRDSYLHIKNSVFAEKDFLHLKRYLMAHCKAIPEKFRTANFANVDSLRPRFSDWVGSPPITSLITQILGPDVALWSLGVCYKPANSFYRVPAHVDSHFWREWKILEPIEVLTLFIPLTRMTATTGCLRVLPQINYPKLYAHKPVCSEKNFFIKEIEDPDVDLGQMIDVEMEENEVCLIKENLIHSSENNSSPLDRLGLTLRYISTAVKYRPHPDDKHKIFLVHGINISKNSCDELSRYPGVGGFSWDAK